jgi:hypothetical protein
MIKDEIRKATIKKDKYFTYQIFKCCIDKAKGKKDWIIYWFVCYNKRQQHPIFDSKTFDEYQDLKEYLKEYNIKIRLKDFKKYD